MIDAELPERVPFDTAPDAVKAVLESTLRQSERLISAETAYLSNAGGKYFRAKLLLAAAVSEDGTDPKNAVVCAAALELLHLATLVHDDVIDDADVRRGQPSVQKRFGKKSAVLCGDYLFCRCFSLVAELSGDYREKFTDLANAMTKICLGELREYRHIGDTSLSVREYFKIIAGKTAALFSLSLYAGSIIGGHGEKDARLLARFGYYVGMLFQLADDCMDYETDLETAKKTVQHDLSSEIVTLPLIYALGKRPELRAKLKSLKGGELRAVVAEVIALGGVSHTRHVAEKYREKAADLLDRMPDDNRRPIFFEILGKITVRNY